MRIRLVSAAAALLLAGPAALRASTWTVPGTVDVSGLNGTRFVSDLAVTNPGAAPVLATVALVPANGTAPAPITLGPGQTVVTRGLLQQLWGTSGAGATVITASSPLLIRARTYNNAASGTYGVALPVIPDDRFLAEGDSGESLWVSQSADGSKGYRTNVAVFFPDAGGGDATVTVYDSAGNEVGSQAYSLAGPGFQQFPVGSFAGAVDVGRAELEVTRGRAGGYAVVVDNVTGDSSLFAFEDLPSGRQDVLVNGVARASGRLGTFFRTDARLYNPASGDATVTVAFHANQGSNPGPVTASVTVPAGKILDVVDVLQTLLGLPVGSAGALRFTSESPVAILCRTSNVDPSGVVPGTYGAQQKPVPVLSFLTSADAGAVVTGIRQGTSFRTNIGFAAGEDGANWTLTLKTASGAAVGTATGSLGAWGWTQPNVQDLFSGTTVPADATLQVAVTAGSVDIFDSSIDNSSGDSVVTPVMPLPAAIPSSATIGPAGGSLQSSDGRLTLLFPAGAVAAPTALSIGNESSDAPQGIGSGYALSPSAVTFAKPLIARMSYTPDDIAGSGPSGLAIAFRGADGWYSIGGGLADTGRRTLSVVLPGGTLPAVRAGRTAADLPTPWGPHLGFLNAWAIVPKTATVLESGQTHFSAYYAGPPSTIPCITPYCASKLTSPYGVNVAWYVGGTLGGNPAKGQVFPLTGTSTTYTAPCGRHGHIPVQFQISEAGTGDLATWPPDSKAMVQIFPRSWSLRIDMTHTGACPAGIEFNWSSFVTYRFLVANAGGAVTGFTKIDGMDTANVANACFAKAGCSLQLDPSWPGVTLQGVQATLDLGANALEFTWDYTEMATLIGWASVTCQSGTHFDPVATIPGKSYSVGPIPMGPGVDSQTRQEPPKNQTNFTKFTLTAVPNPSCPP